MDGPVQYLGLGTFSTARLATLGYSVVNSLVCLAYCVWTILIFTSGSFDSNILDWKISLVIISVMGVLGQAIGFYAIALNHLGATSIFIFGISFNFGFLVVKAIFLAPIFWFGAIFNLAGSFIIMLYNAELKKARREEVQLNSSASGY